METIGGTPNPDNSRRDFIKKLGIFLAATLVAPNSVFSKSTLEKTDNRPVKSVEMTEMPDQGNLHEGFVRRKVNLEFDDSKGKIEGAGSFFSLEDETKGQAQFLSNKSHPDLFKNGVDFDAIKTHYTALGQNVTLVVAGAYYAPGTKEIEGVALEDGVMVGQDTAKSGSNGLLVIKDGKPEIEYVNQIPDFPTYLTDLKNEKADAFQQTSYIRPGGAFTSSNPKQWELRFFVEGTVNGVTKKGVLNFSTAMTYTEAVEAMKKMSGITITKAIGLDTGDMSEGYFYDKTDKKYLMIDEQSGTHRDEYTNVLVLCSKQ